MKSIKPRVTKKSSKRVANEVAPAGPDWLIALVVVLATGLAFLPILSNEFVEWDDSVNLITNPHYRGLLAGGFAIAALSAQRSSGTLKTLNQYDTFSRIGQAAYTLIAALRAADLDPDLEFHIFRVGICDDSNYAQFILP
jgi:hypothetical protein